MKKTLNFAVCALALCAMGTIFAGCDDNPNTLTLGKYNESAQTFTAVTEGYSMQQSGTNLTLKGTIPYSESMLGIDAGNIIAIKIKPNTTQTPDSATSIKTTNRQDTQNGGWNVYDQSALEQDGSVIWVTSVNKDNNVQIKIKWNANVDEITYTLTVDSSATLQTAQ